MPTERIGNLDTQKIAKILAVALEEFANASYKQASFNEVIKKCGISKGTMYYYFKGKEDLYLTLIAACSRDFRPLVTANQQNYGNPSDFWESSERLLQHAAHLMASKPFLARFMSQFLSRENRHISSPAKIQSNKIDDWLQEHLLSGQLIGAIRRDLPVELLIELAWSVWDTASRWFAETDRVSLDADFVPMVMDMLKRLLQPTSRHSASDQDSLAP